MAVYHLQFIDTLTLTLEDIGSLMNTLSFQNYTSFLPVKIRFLSRNFNLTSLQIDETVLNPGKRRTTWLNGSSWQSSNGSVLNESGYS